MSAAAETRDPIKQPFSSDSIWNLPIGTTASYVPARIQPSTAWGGMQVDNDILILTPTAPVSPVSLNTDGWGPGNRCTAQGGVLFSAPIPSGFVVPGSHSGSADGVTPNYAAAVLGADGHTLYQGQPFARCTPGGAATMWWFQKTEDLFGLGTSGAHGGSMLSSIGGTVRLGELVPGGAIRHAVKVNLDGSNLYPGLGGYRWPATRADWCRATCYTGTNPALLMGTLLALQLDFNFTLLETEPGRMLAHAFQDYGGYVVDNAGWPVYGLSVEFSPSGRVVDQFRTAWGFDMNPPNKATPWARDLDRMYTALAAVDNWNATTWATVSASAGTLGAGLGVPRVSWAAALALWSPPPAAPSAPRGLQATAGNAQVGLTWQAPATNGSSPVTNYNVYRGTTSGSLSFLVKIGNVLTFTDAGLGNGQTYYYQVAAISGVGESPRSAQVSGTPAVPPLTSDFVWTVSGRSVTFTLSALGGTPPYRFRLTYGDGANSGWTTTTQLSHAYANAGQYKVVLTVSDAAGRQVTKTKYVTVA